MRNEPQAVRFTQTHTTPDGDVILQGTRGLVIGVEWKKVGGHDGRDLPHMVVVTEHYVFPDTGQVCVGRGLCVSVNPDHLESTRALGNDPSLRKLDEHEVDCHLESMNRE